MNCIQCGKSLAPDEKFCSNCGAPRPAPLPPSTLPEAMPKPAYPLERKPRRRWPLAALILVVGFAVIAGAALMLYANRLPFVPLAPAPAATVLPPSATPTPTDTPSPTPPPPTPTALATATLVPTAVPDLQVVFSDEFTTGCNLWQGDDAHNSLRCENGAYTLLGKTANWNRWINYTQPYSNVIAEVDASTLAGTGSIAHGLIFGVSGDSASGFAFLVSQRGDFVVYGFGKSGNVVLIPWTRSVVIKTGAVMNHLKVVAQGDDFAVYANDQWLNTVVNTGYSGGRIGFLLSNDAAGAKVAFDNLRVSQINKPVAMAQPLPVTATPTPTATRIPTTATPVPTATAAPTATPKPTATTSPAAKLRAQLDEAWGAGDWQRVITLIEALRTLDPTDLTLPDKLYAARVNYGLQLLNAGNLPGALSQCQAALVINPSGGEALQCVARAQPKPTATATRIYVPPTATPTTIYVPPPQPTPNYYTLYLTVRGYEQWGRPNPNCRSGFNDKSPVRKFTVDFTLVNGSPYSIDQWYPRFYTAAGRSLYVCYYEYDEDTPVPGVPPGGTRTVTFAAFAELNEYVTRMSLSVNNYQFQRCFAPYDGHEVPCQ